MVSRSQIKEIQPPWNRIPFFASFSASFKFLCFFCSVLMVRNECIVWVHVACRCPYERWGVRDYQQNELSATACNSLARLLRHWTLTRWRYTSSFAAGDVEIPEFVSARICNRLEVLPLLVSDSRTATPTQHVRPRHRCSWSITTHHNRSAPYKLSRGKQ